MEAEGAATSLRARRVPASSSQDTSDDRNLVDEPLTDQPRTSHKEDKERRKGGKKRNRKDEDDDWIIPEFLHNNRFWVPFLPTVVVLFALGGKVVWGTVIVGIMVGYICDMLGTKIGTLISAWVTLFVVECALFVSGIYLLWYNLINVFILFNIAFFILFVGIWLTLQFTWIRSNKATVFLARTLERFLFATFHIPATVVTTWGVVAVYGMDNAPFYLLVFMYLNYLLFGLPVKSSFGHRYKPTLERKSDKEKKAKASSSSSKREEEYVDPDYYVCGPGENAFHTIAFLVFPALFHIAIYHRVLLSGWLNISNFILVLGLPILLVRIVVNRNALWWTGFTEKGMTLLRVSMTFLSVIVLVACFEYRVIFHSFYHSINILPPWNYVFVTLALYIFAFLVTFHFMGYNRILGRKTVSGLGMFGALAASLVLGVNWYLIPFAIMAAYFLVNFYFRRQFSYYLYFVLSAAVLVMWFIHRTFWFLNFFFYVSSISLQSVSALLLGMFVLSLLLPGLMILNKWIALNSLIFCVHAVLLTYIETVLCTQGSEVYPSYLVIFTSVVGAFLARRLEQEKRVTGAMAWVSMCLYISKLSLLLPPITWAVPSAFALLVAVSPAYKFYLPGKMPSSHGIAYAVAIGVVSFVTRKYITAAVINMVTQRPPTEVLLFAAFLIIWGLACLRISMVHFPTVGLARNVNFFVLVMGFVFAMVQPDFGFSGLVGIRSKITAMQGSMSSIESPQWPQWMLMTAVLLTVGAFSVAPIKNSSLWRNIYAIVTGACVGLFICGVYLPFSTLYITFTGIFVTMTYFIVFTQWPTPSSSRLLPIVFLWMTTLSVATYFLSGRAFTTLSGQVGKEYLKTWRMVLLGICCTFYILIALFLKFKVSFASAFSSGPRRAVPQPAPSGPRSRQGMASTEDEWMAWVGNLSAIIGLVVALFLNIQYLEGGDTSVFVLAPILLLLHPDKRLFRELRESNRYFPLMVAVSSFLILRSVGFFCQVLYHLLFSSSSAALPTTATLLWAEQPWTAFLVLKNVVWLLLTLPNHYLFNNFLKNYERQGGKSASGRWIMLVTPLNLLPAFFADLSAITLLGVAGLIQGGLQLYISRQIRLMGLRSV